MYAAVLTGPKQFEIKKTPIPEPAVGEVRVQLEGCGVSGSNLAAWEGRPWFNYPFEAGSPGHEGWGVVEAVGQKVKTISVGQRVALLSYRAFAEYDVAKEDAVVALPQALNDKPFPGEALGCAMNVFRRCEIKTGQTVAVIGIGFMGALLTSLASRAGARVIAISRRPFALNVACQMGAAEVIPMNDHAQIIDRVETLTDGSFCDCVIEAVGAQWPLDLAGEISHERGRLVIAGYHQDSPRQVNMQLWNWRGLDVINAHERDPQVYVAGIRDAVQVVASNRLNPVPLYTHTFALDKISEAFKAMSARPNNFLKALIQP